jgi:hypothetical protein
MKNRGQIIKLLFGYFHEKRVIFIEINFYYAYYQKVVIAFGPI